MLNRVKLLLMVLLVSVFLMGMARAQEGPVLDIETNLLATLLVQLINGGGAGWLAFEIWKKLIDWWPAIKEWDPFGLRVAVVATCMALAIGSYFILGWLAIFSFPTTPQMWVSVLFAVAATAYTSSQLFHSKLKKQNGT